MPPTLAWSKHPARDEGPPPSPLIWLLSPHSRERGVWSVWGAWELDLLQAALEVHKIFANIDGTLD